MEKAKVYFTKEITPDSLIRIYHALGRELKGKVDVKISTGEPGGHNYLHPELIGDLVRQLDGTIVECCTAVSYTHLHLFRFFGMSKEYRYNDPYSRVTSS